MCYFNQRVLVIHRVQPNENKGTKKQFISVYNNHIEEAAKRLNGAAFKYYIYLLMNKDGYALNYSPEHFRKTFGVGLTSAKSVFDELIKAGYIVPNNDGSYDFFEEAKEQKIIIEKEKRGFKQSDGNIVWLTYNDLLNLVNNGNVAETNIDWSNGIIGGNSNE